MSDETHPLDQLAASASGFGFDPVTEATAMASAAGWGLLRWRGGGFVWDRAG